MKTFHFQKIFLAVVAAAGLALSTLTLAAQDSTVSPAPLLAYGVPQVLQLVQAKVTDDVIIAYIHNSGNSYGLNADQIIYLRQQGISDRVLAVMLNQPKPASTPAPTAPAPAADTPQPQVVYTPTPAPAYVQPASSSTVYVMPNNQIYYSSYYPYYYPYSYCPGVSLAFGFGGGYGGGYYYGGGYRGGYYGGYHGGYYGGYHGGGYHGGGGWHH